MTVYVPLPPKNKVLDKLIKGTPFWKLGVLGVVIIHIEKKTHRKQEGL